MPSARRTSPVAGRSKKKVGREVCVYVCGRGRKKSYMLHYSLIITIFNITIIIFMYTYTLFLPILHLIVYLYIFFNNFCMWMHFLAGITCNAGIGEFFLLIKLNYFSNFI